MDESLRNQQSQPVPEPFPDDGLKLSAWALERLAEMNEMLAGLLDETPAERSDPASVCPRKHGLKRRVCRTNRNRH